MFGAFAAIIGATTKCHCTRCHYQRKHRNGKHFFFAFGFWRITHKIATTRLSDCLDAFTTIDWLATFDACILYRVQFDETSCSPIDAVINESRWIHMMIIIALTHIADICFTLSWCHQKENKQSSTVSTRKCFYLLIESIRISLSSRLMLTDVNSV